MSLIIVSLRGKHTHIHAHTYTHTCTHTHRHTHKHIHIYIHTYKRAHILTVRTKAILRNQSCRPHAPSVKSLIKAVISEFLLYYWLNRIILLVVLCIYSCQLWTSWSSSKWKYQSYKYNSWLYCDVHL